MALSVNTNVASLNAMAAASKINNDMETSMNRLSTGKRINTAADDAAGIAIAARLTSEIKGTNQAIRNALDGQAMIDTAEGSHAEIETLLQRMREIAVQAASDTNDSDDRANLQAELDQLSTEITRIATVSTWAGQQLLNGAGTGTNTTTTQATATTDKASFDLQIGANSGTNEKLTVEIKAMSARALGVDSKGIAAATVTASVTSANSASAAQISTTAAGGYKFISGTATTTSTGSAAVTTTGVRGMFGATFKLIISSATATVTNVSTTDDTPNTASGVAQQMADQINTQFSDKFYAVVDGDTLQVRKYADIRLNNATNAVDALDTIDLAIKTLNTQRANLGSISNRLDNTVSNLTNISTNLEAGRGRIQDADFAAESSALAKAQILSQASTAMLAQANAAKQGVLQLLKG